MTAPHKDDEPAPPVRPLAWWNFALLAVGGLAFLCWVAWFTDWLVPALAVIGLGGVLTWPRTLVGWIPGIGDGLKNLLRRVMESRLTLALVLLSILAAGIASLWVGSISVRSLEPKETRRLTFRPADGDSSTVLFEGGSEVRRPFWTAAGGSREVEVEVEGYPPTDVEIHPWQRTRLVVPDDLSRPIVLVLPKRRLVDTVSAVLKDEAQDYQVEMEVELQAADGATDARAMSFDGHSVWIGCSAECDVPSSFVEQWDEQPAYIARRWLAPRKLAGAVQRLKVGDSLTVRVTINGKAVASRRFSVRAGQEVQMEELDVE